MTYCWVIVDAPWVELPARVAERGADDALRVDAACRSRRSRSRRRPRRPACSAASRERDRLAVLGRVLADLGLAVGVVDERRLGLEVLVGVRDVGRACRGRRTPPTQTRTSRRRHDDQPAATCRRAGARLLGCRLAPSAGGSAGRRLRSPAGLRDHSRGRLRLVDLVGHEGHGARRAEPPTRRAAGAGRQRTGTDRRSRLRCTGSCTSSDISLR